MTTATKKVIVHSSGNPHYLENATDVVTEESFTAEDNCQSSHAEHGNVHVLKSSNCIGFVQQFNPSLGIVERIRD